MRMSFHRVRKTVAPGETLGMPKPGRQRRSRMTDLTRSSGVKGTRNPEGREAVEVLRQQNFREGRSNNNDSGHIGTGN